MGKQKGTSNGLQVKDYRQIPDSWDDGSRILPGAEIFWVFLFYINVK